MHKYGAKKTQIDGITFDSKAESIRYQELKLLERAKEIEQLKLQPAFVLQPAFAKNGKKYRAITYKADFQYYDTRKHKMVIEDVKGFKTKEFMIKQKMFEYVYPGMTLEVV